MRRAEQVFRLNESLVDGKPRSWREFSYGGGERARCVNRHHRYSLVLVEGKAWWMLA